MRLQSTEKNMILGTNNMNDINSCMKSFKEHLLFENDKKRSYSCLMLDCGILKDDIEKIQSQIQKSDIYDQEGYGLETEPHITVLYGIHTADPETVASSVDCRVVSYSLSGLSLFENSEFDVLKCTVVSDDLHELNKQCTDRLDYTNDYPDYKPHLTVAYLKPGTGKKYLDIDSVIFEGEKTSGDYLFSDMNSNKTHLSYD